MKLEYKKSSKDRRLVLGFDGGCLSCSMLAQRIREQVGDKLEIKNLRDPQVRGWRKETLGEDTPWIPILLEVHGEEAFKAWTGLRMGAALTRRLGPGDTWRVMQAIGEMRPTKERLIPGRFSRGQFLTGLGGAALAMTMLSGTGKLAYPAAAQGNRKGNRNEINGADLVGIARRKANTQDVRNVVGNDWADRMQTGDVERRCLPKGGCEIAIATGGKCHLDIVRGEDFRVQGYCSVPKGAKHKIQRGDNGVLKVAWAVPKEDWLIIYKQYDRPFNPNGHGDIRVETMAMLYKRVDRNNANKKGANLRLVRVSVNGKERKRGNWAS